VAEEKVSSVVEPDVPQVEQVVPVAEVAVEQPETVREPTPWAHTSEPEQLIEIKPEHVVKVIQESISVQVAETVQITERASTDVPEEEPVDEVLPGVIQPTMSETVEEVIPDQMEELPLESEVAIASVHAVAIEIANIKQIDETPAGTDNHQPLNPEVPIITDTPEQVEVRTTEESVTTESDLTPAMVQFTEAPLVADETSCRVVNEEPTPESVQKSIMEPDNADFIQKTDRPMLPTELEDTTETQAVTEVTEEPIQIELVSIEVVKIDEDEPTSESEFTENVLAIFLAEAPNASVQGKLIIRF